MAAIEKIHILKFRNLSDQYFTPNKEINLVLGKNGQGKTNLIESLYYLGHGRSFKTKKLKNIIPFDDHQIQITAIVDGQKISLKKTRERSQVEINGKKILLLKGASEYVLGSCSNLHCWNSGELKAMNDLN